MYRISNYSGEIENLETNEIFEQDDRLDSYNEYYEWHRLGGTPEFVAFFDGEIQKMTIKTQISKEFKAYEKRRQDGINAYNQINAEFRVLKINGVIDQNYYDSISEQLGAVVFQITNGQWVSGLQKLETLGSSQIGQQLYDRLHLQITNYVNQSYSE